MFCKNCGAHMNDNQAFCSHCGTKSESQKNSCPNCGIEVAQGAAFCTRCGTPIKQPGTNPHMNNNFSTSSTPMPSCVGIQSRSLVTAIILSLVTCGIYSIYWFVSLTNEMNQLSGRQNDTSGGMAFFLNLITCGIYSLYWSYKMGEKRDYVAKENGSSNILYLVLAIFGLGIVSYCLIQDTINKVVENKQY